MSVQIRTRAVLSLAAGIVAPVLSSACAHDARQGLQDRSDAAVANAARPHAGRTGTPSGYGSAYRVTHPRRGSIRSGAVAARGRGPTYVEATFERRKSAVGPPFRERFHGFAMVAPNGRSTIEIQNVGETVRCSGRSRVTAPPTGPGATGLRGEAFISCSDGRYAIADYRYVTNTRGEGEGKDYLGNRFTIRFMVVP
jgi:hypothetical protein